jgi:peptidoglycan/LPS O-acetylase OafA/YrhL
VLAVIGKGGVVRWLTGREAAVNHAACRRLNDARASIARMRAIDDKTIDGVRRLRFLDGLRGWAAVVVLLHHVLVDGLPANDVMADRALWAKVFFLNGTLAVCVFFVISGFSLSIRYLETGDGSALGRVAAGRYLRLAIPIFAICVITHALLLLAVIPPAAQRPPPLDAFLTFAPSLRQLLSFSLAKVFVAYTNAETYDPPLWTMSYEFYGSFMTFAIAAWVRPQRRRAIALAALFVALAVLQTYFALFVGGVLLAELYRSSAPAIERSRAGVALCVIGLLLLLLPSAWFGAVYVAGGTCLTAGVIFCRPLRGFFENRLSAFLGRISFPLYLTQAAVIYALAPRGLALAADLGFAAEAQRLIVAILLIPLALLCAIAFCPINDFAVAASRRFGASAVAFGTALDRRLARRSRLTVFAPSRE